MVKTIQVELYQQKFRETHWRYQRNRNTDNLSRLEWRFHMSTSCRSRSIEHVVQSSDKTRVDID